MTLRLFACGVVAGAALFFGASAGAQVVDNSASTVGESYARGVSDVISAQGNYNLQTSQAAINMTQVQKNEMENYSQWTQTYFETRQMNRDYREKERGKRPTEEDLVRYAAMGKPKPLSPSELDYVTGKIRWPIVLTQPTYQPQCKQLDSIFAKRAQGGALGYDDQVKIRTTTSSMLEALKASIQTVAASDYLAAKRFLESLAFEGQRVAG